MSEKEKKDEEYNSSVVLSKDPGASRHGNFMNYYKFHSAEERARQLPRGVWRRPTSQQNYDRKYIGLDVGCNTGDLTILLHDFLRREINDDSNSNLDVILLGIDIDQRLIDRARESNKISTKTTMTTNNQQISFECLDFMEKSARHELLDSYLKKFSRKRFDVIFCFSVTMWIHLNHGDDGLVDYLMALCSLTDIIVIEPQSWKCYRNASRRMRRAGLDDFELLNSLKLTGNISRHIERIIVERCSFVPLVITDANDWGRKLLIYERERR